MGSRSATWLDWSMCVVAVAAMAGTLEIDGTGKTVTGRLPVGAMEPIR